jgi:lipopolysaccharide transport system ATP-binding protein
VTPLLAVLFGGRVASTAVGTSLTKLTQEKYFPDGAILGMIKKVTSKLNEIIEFSGCERYIDTCKPCIVAE